MSESTRPFINMGTRPMDIKFFLKPSNGLFPDEVIERTNKQRLALTELVCTCLAGYIDRDIIPFCFRATPDSEQNWFDIFIEVQITGRSQILRIAHIKYSCQEPLEDSGYVEFIIPDEFDEKYVEYDEGGWDRSYVLSQDGFSLDIMEDLLEHHDPKILLKYFNWKRVKIPLKIFLHQECHQLLDTCLKNWNFVCKALAKVKAWDYEKLQADYNAIKKAEEELRRRRYEYFETHGKKFGMLCHALPLQGLPHLNGPDEDGEDVEEEVEIHDTSIM